MIRRRLLLLLPLALIGCERHPSYTRLVWHDEFDGPSGASFDSSKWSADTGGTGFGNHEHQFYTSDVANVAQDGRGHLVIAVRAEPANTTHRCWYGQCLYSSARLETKGRYAAKYGRIEARIRIPRGLGIWPAFWMMGADIDSVGWPANGEIDVMENRGSEPAAVYGTAHGPGYSGSAGISRADTLSSGALADAFHVYAIEWEPDEIRWYRDGHEYHRMTPGDLPRGTRWVFDHPFFLLMNVALDGDWSGAAMDIPLPQTMVVDYVRVYGAPSS